MKNNDDNYLMNKVKNGDLSHMGILFERHHKVLFGYFYRLTGNASKSEDMMQNVFFRLLKYRNTFRNEGKFVYWMYAVARNVSNDGFRKSDLLSFTEDLTLVEEEPSDSLNREEELVQKERQQHLKIALQQLGPEQKEAIVMSKYQGFKYHEIAKIVGVSESAIKARIRRGMMELKKLMNDVKS